MIELVLEDRCNGCGVCEEICPTNVFDIGPNGIPVIARQAECHTCYLCEAQCPTDALYVGPLRNPQAVTREEALASGSLGNFRRALGFDQHEPGSFCYAGDENRLYGRASASANQSKGPDAAIYAALAVANQHGLVDVSQRVPLTREIII